jgi:hypothetical protein
MGKTFDAAEGTPANHRFRFSDADLATAVAQHTTPDSCWVILYGNAYDVSAALALLSSRFFLHLTGVVVRA